MDRYGIKSYAEAKKYNRLDGLFEALDEEIKGLSLAERQALGMQRIKVYKTAYADTAGAYGDAFGVSFGGPNKKSYEAFKQMPVIGTDIKDETANKRRKLENAVRKEVNRGLILGESPLTIARRISKAGRIAQYQARTLARTNVIAAHGQAVIDFKEANNDIFTGVRWFTQLDERTCPICAPLHGKDFYKDQPPHPAHYNCRCALNPIAEPAIQKELDKYSEITVAPSVAAKKPKKVKKTAAKKLTNEERLEQLIASNRKRQAELVRQQAETEKLITELAKTKIETERAKDQIGKLKQEIKSQEAIVKAYEKRIKRQERRT